MQRACRHAPQAAAITLSPGLTLSAHLSSLSPFGKVRGKTLFRTMPNILLLLLAALFTSFACCFALQEHDLSAHAPVPCGFELVWPSSDSIVLLAARSLTVEVVLKLWGNCSAFLHPVSPSRSHLKIAFLGYAWWWDKDIDGPASFFEPVTAVPLGLYWDVSSAALSSSPLLFQSSQAIQSGDLSQLPWDVAGRHDRAFSLWTFNVQYMKDMLKPHKSFEIQVLGIT